MPARAWIVLGALTAALAVALGAFGAHGLRERLEPRSRDSQDLEQRLANYDTAVRYQMFQSVGIVLTALIAGRARSSFAQAALVLHLAGTVLFSVMLYAYVFDGPRFVVALVPVGGLLMILGWLATAAAGWKLRDAELSQSG
jgi:uncharacterized membrane protein YgdD (TMEM256/DUF423 family)